MWEQPIYLDYAATTPCDPRVAEAIIPYFTTYFGNASSRQHAFGWHANAAVEIARKSVASLVAANPEEIIFTSGATEACNLALRGVFEMYAAKGNHIITVKTEHKAVLDTCKTLQKKGAEITYLNVSSEGLIDVEELKKAIKPTTILIAIMYANNETGVMQPVKEIGAISKKNDVLFFCDATQAVGKIPVNVLEDDIDLMAFSSHKIYGPKGIGALYVRKKNPRVKITAQITGGGQEGELRSGTLNVPAIVGFGKTCEICEKEMEDESKRIKNLRDFLEEELLQIPDTQLNGDKKKRLPNVANISFKYTNSSQLLATLNKTIALSSGSACTSGSLDPSYVLTAMNIDEKMAKAALRFSLGRFTTKSEIEFTIEEVKKIVQQLRNENFEWQLAEKEKAIIQ